MERGWLLKSLGLVVTAGAVGCSLDPCGSGAGCFMPGATGAGGTGGDDGVASDDGSGGAGTGGTAADDDGRPFDSGPNDSGPADSGSADSGSADSGPVDSGPADDGWPGDTGPGETGSGDTGSGDTGPSDTGPVDTGGADDCQAVARAADVGCGRLFVWGDEHVDFDDNYALAQPFWANAIQWLADGSACGTDRTHVHFAFSPPADLVTDLEGLGYTVTSGFAGTDADILVTDAWSLSSAGTPTELQAWVEGGGALMTTIAGLGDGDPSECDEPNGYIGPMGIEYGCESPAPWGDDLGLASHPITAGLTTTNTPFVNGRFVHDEGADSAVVAYVGAGEGCTMPPPDPPPQVCHAVGRTTEVGCGRLFVWGDEHVKFADEYDGAATFWANAIEWLSDPGSCGVDREHVYFVGNVGPELVADLESAGYIVDGGGIPDPSALGGIDILVYQVNDVGSLGATEVAALQEWVGDGGALMTMIGGLGDADTTECDEGNAVIGDLGLGYECVPSPPWGPVTNLLPHPIAASVDADALPFVNGRWVVDTDGTSATVATVGTPYCGDATPAG